MKSPLTRRAFLGRSACLTPFFLAASGFAGRAAEPTAGDGLDFPLVDYHVHLDNSSLAQVLPLARERQVKFGIVEHAGTKENKYPVVLANDADLDRYVAGLEGQPVYKGVQAEWTDWMGCFSTRALARLDYVLTDAMTFPGTDGRRAKLWEPDVAQRVDLSNPQAFMDRFVDWHVEILTREPLDILVNVSWLPNLLAAEHERLWTAARMDKVIDALVKQQVALEISASYKLPKRPFLERAKAAGVKFCFGSNGRFPNMGKLEYSIQMARELGLTRTHIWTPVPGGPKAARQRA